MLTITVDSRPSPMGLGPEALFPPGFARLSSRHPHMFARCPAPLGRRLLRVGCRSKLAVLLLLLAPASATAEELKPETLQAWDAYVCAARTRMAERASGKAPFLWVDEDRNLTQRLRAGEIVVESMNGDSPHTVPHGLIHHWIGAVFVPKVKIKEVMGVLGDYDRYKDFYRPMVVKATLVEQSEDHQKVTLLTMSKAYSMTGAVEADNEVTIARLGSDRVYSMSTSVRLQEIADYGKASEHLLPEDHGPGYVWRTFNLTRLQQSDDGVYVELEVISLSRDIPWMFRWLVQPLAERLPRNILSLMVQDTRDAVSREIKEASLKSEGFPR
jgi:hypothetical protein